MTWPVLFQSHQLVGVLSLIDFERVARAHLPRPLFHYVYESLEDGAGHCDNRDAFAEFGFVARALTNVSRRSVRTTLFNRSDAQPFGIAPMGLAALTAYRGDLVIVRAGVNVPHDLGPREHLDWELVRLTCKTWKGNLVVKGLLAIEDALTAKNCGADGLILSNHSGRQFDGTVSALRVLHGICTAVDDLALVLDGLAHRCIASRSGGATRFASAFATGPDQADMHCKRGVFIRRHRWPGASCRRPAGTCHRSADDTHTVSRRRTRPGRGNGRWYRLYFRHDVGPQKIRVRPVHQADCHHGGARHPDFPTVPTMTEAGIKAFDDVGAWFGFLAPAIVARLNSVIACQGLAARTPCRTGHGAIGWPAVGFQNLPRGRLHAVSRAHHRRRHQGAIGRTALAVRVDRGAWITND